jgi:hypothetical protein
VWSRQIPSLQQKSPLPKSGAHLLAPHKPRLARGSVPQGGTVPRNQTPHRISPNPTTTYYNLPSSQTPRLARPTSVIVPLLIIKDFYSRGSVMHRAGFRNPRSFARSGAYPKYPQKNAQPGLLIEAGLRCANKQTHLGVT